MKASFVYFDSPLNKLRSVVQKPRNIFPQQVSMKVDSQVI